MTDRRYTYVDFTKVPVTGVFAQTTHAVATGADDQVDYTRVGEAGHYFQWIQTEASTTIFPVASASGWTIPIGATDGDAIIMDQGIVAGNPTLMKFVTGTDSFFIKCKMEITTLADTDVVAIGFRELAAYDVDAGGTYPNTPATAVTYYDEKAIIGTSDGAGAVRGVASIAGVDTATAATSTPVVTGTAVTWEVRIGADLGVTYYVDGVADVLLNAAGHAVGTGVTMIPYIVCISTGAGAELVEIASYECGLLPA